MILHDYQERAVAATLRSIRRGRNPLVVMPTGTGKTVVFTEIIRRRRGRAMVLAHRAELLDQAAEHLERCGITADIERAGRRASSHARVVVASVQSVARQGRAIAGALPQLLVIDEAHHAAAKSYRNIAARYPGARVAGFTATPDHLDKRSLTVFNDVAFEYDLRDAIAEGRLVSILQRRVVVESIDVSRVTSVLGDFDQRQLDRICRSAESLQGVAVPIVEHAGQRPTIAFAASVPHAHALARVLNRIRAGVARVVTGNELPEKRALTLAAFGAGEFQILVNCQVLTEGFDAPQIACVAMARPTKSRALYAQAVGRGTRLHPGKEDLLVLDFCGNAGKHQLVTAVDLLAFADERAEVIRAAKDIVSREPNTAAHTALRLARGLPADVLERYRVEDVAVDRRPLCAAGCGKPVARMGLKHCSPECRWAGKSAALPERNCVRCSDPFVPLSHNPDQKYCNPDCYQNRYRDKRAERFCANAECGGPIDSRDLRQKFCNKDCYVVAQRKIAQVNRQFTCAECGVAFTLLGPRQRDYPRRCKGCQVRQGVATRWGERERRICAAGCGRPVAAEHLKHCSNECRWAGTST